MKLAYLASAFFPDLEPMWMLRDSAAKLGVPLQYYGLGKPYGGFIQAKIDLLLPELQRLSSEGYTHVLYADGNDTFFTRGPAEIEAGYAALGSPEWLFSAETTCYPHEHLREVIPAHLRFPNTGQYMGNIESIVVCWNALRHLYDDGADNEQGWVTRAFAEGNLTEAKVDRDCRIFRSEADDYEPGMSGCMLHFNGGYNDPQTGRMSRMRPVWDKVFGC